MSKQESDCKEDVQTKAILNELKIAYRSISSLQKSPTHRKIALELEQKIRKENKKNSSL